MLLENLIFLIHLDFYVILRNQVVEGACHLLRRKVSIRESCSGASLTPAEKQALAQHVQAIAQRLYKESAQSRMTKLGELAVVLREPLQPPVQPPLGVF